MAGNSQTEMSGLLRHCLRISAAGYNALDKPAVPLAG